MPSGILDGENAEPNQCESGKINDLKKKKISRREDKKKNKKGRKRATE